MHTSKSEKEWLGVLLSSALENEIMAPGDILGHATPEILAAHLPPEVMSKVLAASLKAGTMTPEVILEVADTRTLAEHVPSNILWRSVQKPVKKADEASDSQENRVLWLSTVFDEALRLKIFDTAHILTYATPEVMSADLPRPLVSAIIQAGLDKGQFNPDLVFKTLGAVALVENLDFSLMWRCAADVGDKAFLSGKEKTKDTVTAEYALLDDEVVEDFNALLADDEAEEVEVLEPHNETEEVEQLDGNDVEVLDDSVLEQQVVGEELLDEDLDDLAKQLEKKLDEV